MKRCTIIVFVLIGSAILAGCFGEDEKTKAPKKDYFNLTGKVALVTGASSGLGKHFAKTLSNHGARIILAARREDKLVKLSKALNTDSFIVPLDVSILSILF